MTCGGECGEAAVEGGVPDAAGRPQIGDRERTARVGQGGGDAVVDRGGSGLGWRTALQASWKHGG